MKNRDVSHFLNKKNGRRPYFSCIALSITDQETNAQIKNLGVGLLELRVDLFKNLDPVYIAAQIKHRKSLKIPLLLTVRNQKSEGALRVFADQKKWEIITQALPLVDMVDIELTSPLLGKVVALARKHKVKVIVSSHFLKSMPRDLGSIFKKSLRAGANMVKIAGLARSFDDVMAMLNFTYKICHSRESGSSYRTIAGARNPELITMCLGPRGAISRVLFPAAGSRYTYTFLHRPTAPGQMDIFTLKAHLKAYCHNF